jgi:hypothetical protein
VTGAPGGVLVEISCGILRKSTHTDAAGRYAFSGLPVASCVVTPSLPDYLFEPPSTELPAEEASRSGVDFVARPVLQVYGCDMGADVANVAVNHGGARVEDAVVRADGTLIPFSDLTQRFSGYLERVLQPGEALSLEVTSGGATVRGSGVIPDVPVLTAPSDGASLSAGADLLVGWTSSTSPEYFEVDVQWPYVLGGHEGRSFHAAGDDRSAVIPAGDIPDGEIYVRVMAYNDGALIGDYVPFPDYPGMNIRSDSVQVTIHRN